MFSTSKIKYKFVLGSQSQINLQKEEKMSAQPLSTSAVESAVLDKPIESVWSKIHSLDFSWWNLVASSQIVEGGVFLPTVSITFKDDTVWVVRVLELSEMKKSLVFELITCTPEAHVASVVHSISLKKITATNGTYIEWATDFSSDVTSQIILDSSLKRLEAFQSI